MQRHQFSFSVAVIGIVLAMSVATLLCVVQAEERPTPPHDTQKETIARMSGEQARASFTVPQGFQVSLFAAEPDVCQPIGIATDERGRLWVAENNTYAERTVGFDRQQRDRIIVLEDRDHDGRAEQRTVFWDQGQLLSSVEIGFGGVWALCPPQLLFIPDRDHNDVPDGPPQVVLDGFEAAAIRHNIANGLRWGPDGWLYGRHGILANSLIGRPGAPPSERTSINCGIWRYHPTRKIFEVVCRGTTNPWGMDWDGHGELFFINTVIGHLWHSIPGAYYLRMYGEHDNPHLYNLLNQTADHFHWDTAETWSKIREGVSPTTAQAGGGHAHSGLIIYQADNWPAKYRDTMLTINFHGRRLNNDKLERHGATYVAHHGEDLVQSGDPWFRGLDLLASPDGGVFISDWSDIGECHDDDGIHRSSGRVFKLTYGQPDKPAIADVGQLANQQLVDLQSSSNEWLVRQARHVLQERAAAGQKLDDVRAVLRKTVETANSPLLRLRALWCLNVVGGAPTPWLIEQTKQPDEHLRSWIVRLLCDGELPSGDSLRALESLGSDPSGLVLVYLASALQKLPLADRWNLAQSLVARSEFAADPTLPLMIWYGIEPAVPDNPGRATQLAESCQMPLVSQSIARRLTENRQTSPAAIDRLVVLASDAKRSDRSRAILAGMSEALRGTRKATMPASWKTLQESLGDTADAPLSQSIRELSAVFGDGRALDDLLALVEKSSADLAARRDAIRVLVETRTSGTAPRLRKLVDDRDLGVDAVRGLAAIGEPDAASFLVARLPSLRDPARAGAIAALSSRPAWAPALLKAVADKKIARDEVPIFQVRQMATFPDAVLQQQIATLWPELKPIAESKRERIEQLKTSLTTDHLAQADVSNGRRRFIQACANCHTLFGQGSKIGPDLTGAQRSNVDYLLENIVDPTATLSTGYRTSTVVLKDGRVLLGIVSDKTPESFALQTATERLVLASEEAESIQSQDRSLMPDGLLDVLSPSEIRDLVAYLMSPRQVALDN